MSNQDHIYLSLNYFHVDLILSSKLNGGIRSLDLLEYIKDMDESLSEISMGRMALRLFMNSHIVMKLRKRSLSEFPHSRYIYLIAIIIDPNGLYL